jgi:hypothetical protein
VDVRLGISRWLCLNNEINTGNVKPSRCHIGCYKNLELEILEALQGDFSLVLGNVTMHYFDLVLNFV